MSNQIIVVFEQIKKINQHNQEFWSARELAKALDYSDYRNFEKVIKKAKESCKNANQSIKNHFGELNEMVEIGSNVLRQIKDIALSRYACYLIMQNADPSKEVVALGQTYFAIQTRRQEVQDQLVEDQKRVYLREEVTAHNKHLAQTARTNRVYPNKGCGKVIDYYGITNNLFDALDFDEDIVSSALMSIDELKKEFEVVLNNTLEFFVGINIEDPSYDNLRTCLNIFADNETKQDYFKTKYSRLKILFEVLSPDPYLKPFIRKFEWLTSVYIAFLKEYSPDGSTMELEEYGEKIKTLIQDKIDYEGITRNFKPLNVHDIYFFERLEEMTDEQKAVALEKSLEAEITRQVEINPGFGKFSEKLSQIRKEFEDGQISLQERIKKYYDLKSQIDHKSDEAKEMGLDLQEYGLFVILQEYIEDTYKIILIELSKAIVKQLSDLLDKGWQDSSKKEELIKTTKRILQELLLKEYKDKIKIKDFSKLANRLVDVIIKKF